MKIIPDVEQIKRELYDYGPLMVDTVVYADFLNYDSGIYQYTEGNFVMGHQMKLVGWGEDSDVGLFWELQNSWTESFGERGFVRVANGEMGVDSKGISCMPDLI